MHSKCSVVAPASSVSSTTVATAAVEARCNVAPKSASLFGSVSHSKRVVAAPKINLKSGVAKYSTQGASNATWE